MTIITGRRRIGKTTLITEAFKNSKFLYFFISRKEEALLCEEFITETQTKLEQPVVGEFKRFAKLFEYLLLQSRLQPITLVLDEFQEFNRINIAIFGDMQNLWDRYKTKNKL